MKYTLKLSRERWRLLYQALGVAAGAFDTVRGDENARTYRRIMRLERDLSKQVIRQRIDAGFDRVRGGR